MSARYGRLPPSLSDVDLQELVARAQAHFDRLTPSQKLRHRYMQKRSFTRGMCPSDSDYKTHCDAVERLMPHEATLTDTQIGLVLAGEKL